MCEATTAIADVLTAEQVLIPVAYDTTTAYCRHEVMLFVFTIKRNRAKDNVIMERILSRIILSVRILPVFHLQLYKNKSAWLQACQSCNVTAQ